MLPQSYVGDAKLGVHPQWHIAEKKIYKGRWAAGSGQRGAGSGPQAVEWAAGRKVGRRQLLAKPKVPDNKTFECFVECYLN